MSQSQTRQQVAEYLTQYGPLEDAKGRATAKLMEALGHTGSAASFTQLISNMDRSGQLTREIRGKRTYRIALATNDLTLSFDDGPDEEESPEMDYDKVASALLIQVVQNLTKGTPERDNDGSWARRRIERLERRVGELEHDLLLSRAESNTAAAERDELQLQLEHSEGNLALLTERLATRKPRERQLAKLLNADERALLHQLRGDVVGEHAGRASYAKRTSR
jgi:hypothetical protein